MLNMTQQNECGKKCLYVGDVVITIANRVGGARDVEIVHMMQWNEIVDKEINVS